MANPNGRLKTPPRQDRSARALERILRATERLLKKRHFEDIGITQILEESGVSASSFYSRFRSKEDVLPVLYAAYSEAQKRESITRFDPARLRGLDLAERIQVLTRDAVRNYRERRGLLRTVALLARSRPQAVTKGALRERSDQYDAACALLLECRGEIRHPKPALAARTGILMALATCRDKILFAEAPHPSSVSLTDDELSHEVARALFAYLTTPPRF